MAFYTDIDLSFNSPHPSTGDFLKKVDVDAAKAALRNLCLTHPGEIIENPTFGLGIKQLQFELMSPILSAFTKRKIIGEVYQWLPEIQIQDIVVDANPDYGQLYIIIEFYVKGVRALQTVNLIMERAR